MAEKQQDQRRPQSGDSISTIEDCSKDPPHSPEGRPANPSPAEEGTISSVDATAGSVSSGLSSVPQAPPGPPNQRQPLSSQSSLSTIPDKSHVTRAKAQGVTDIPVGSSDTSLGTVASGDAPAAPRGGVPAGAPVPSTSTPGPSLPDVLQGAVVQDKQPRPPTDSSISSMDVSTGRVEKRPADVAPPLFNSLVIPETPEPEDQDGRRLSNVATVVEEDPDENIGIHSECNSGACCCGLCRFKPCHHDQNEGQGQA